MDSEAVNSINDYFSSYEDLEIHRLMLNDKVRTEAYKDVAEMNSEYIKGKTVMDVGCGTGILSVFFAKAGASKVYAVEASNIAKLAQKIIEENNLENVIEVIQSKVEDIKLDIKVDIIVSEWMGFYLLHEGMLDSVIYARDKFLKEDGQMFPDSAAIYAIPCSVPSHFEAWSDIYGVSMKSMGEELRKSKMIKPEIMELNEDNIIACSMDDCLCWIDLKTVTKLDSFEKRILAAASHSGKFQGICIHFTVHFPFDLTDDPDIPPQEPIFLRTCPYYPQTHWKQTVVILPDERVVEEGEPIAYDVKITRSQHNRRWYDIQVSIIDPDEIEHPTPCNCHMTKCIIIKKFMRDHPAKSLNGADGDKLDEKTNGKTPFCDESDKNVKKLCKDQENDKIMVDEVISDSE